MSVYTGRLSVAPMMDWTDRHFRFFARQFTKRTLLYTEMVTAQAVVFGDAEKLLSFSLPEKPLILQLGGSSPELLGKACKIAQSFDYDGINLNAGCPSERVSAGNFGAALRQNSALIADCLQAMKENSRVPVSLKTRIALEEMTQDSDGYDDLCRLAELVKPLTSDWIVHARKARLKGLTPKQNRERLPLNYDLVYRFKRDFPDLTVSINGNIDSLDAALQHLQHVDGVMIGRAAYANPALLAEADNRIYGESSSPVSPINAVLQMRPYIEEQLAKGVRLNAMTRHMLGIFKGCAGAAAWRRTLTENAVLPDADFKVVAQALKSVIPID